MLKTPPSDKHLGRAYYELAQIGAQSGGAQSSWPYHPKNREELLALGAEMSRYDPRLLGILVEYFLNHWNDVVPQRLREWYPKMESPQTFGVIAEFVKEADASPEILYFMNYLQDGLSPVASQLYFKNLYTPASPLSQRSAEESLAAYKKWGFLARERPTIDVYQKKTVGFMDKNSRVNLLKRLFKDKHEITLKDYLQALKHPLSRQQALLDLKAIAQLQKNGRGRGACWMLR